jgi:release factor glutamine methyltransferase
MKIKDIKRVFQEKLEKEGIKNPSLEVNILLSYILKLDTNKLILNSEKTLTRTQIQKFEHLINRRLNGEPISHLTGKKAFWDFEFAVDRNTLEPRPDSETLIEAVLKIYKNSTEKNLSILDLGTGSGCLILTLLKLFPNATGLGIDISSKALKIARRNAKSLNVNNRIKFIKNNWNQNITEIFDIIISNPPYIPAKQIQFLQKEIRNFEPGLALDGGNSGLDCYEYIAKNIKTNLAKNGKIFLEIGYKQDTPVIDIFQKNNFNLFSTSRDLNGIIRILCFNA